MADEDYGRCVTDATSIEGLPRLVRDRPDWREVLRERLGTIEEALGIDATVASALEAGGLRRIVMGASPATLKRDRALARVLAEAWGDRQLADVEGVDLHALEDHLRSDPRSRTGAPVSAETLRRTVAMAQELVNAWRKMHGLEPLPMHHVERAAPRPPRRFPSLLEARAILNALEDPAEQVCLTFILGCGLREAEVPRDFETAHPYVYTKLMGFDPPSRPGGEWEDFTKVSIVPEWARSVIDEYLEPVRSETEWPGDWPALRRPLARACARVGAPEYTPSDFRLTWQAVARRFGLPRRLVRNGIHPQDVLILEPAEGVEPPERVLAVRWTHLLAIQTEVGDGLTVSRTAPRVGPDQPELKTFRRKKTAPPFRF